MLNALTFGRFGSSANQNLSSPPPDLPHAQAADDLDETIESMNDAAGKTAQQQLPKKRKATEAEDEPTSPTKKRSPKRVGGGTPPVFSDGHGEPPASRLRSRKSVALRPPVNRKDPFALPAEETERPIPQLKSSQKPVHKAIRRLAKRVADPSPLKGRGVIEMPPAGVDLLDSPDKRRKKPVVEVQRVPRGSSNQKDASIGRANPGQPKRKSPRKQAASRTGLSTSTQKSPAHQVPQTVSAPENEPVPGPNRDLENEEDSSVVDTDDNDDDSAEDYFPGAARQTSGKHATDGPRNASTNAAEPNVQRSKAERLHQEEAEETRKRIAKLMRGFENVSNLHGFRRNWEEMLLAADKILDSRSAYRAESKRGKRLCKWIEYLKNEFQQLKDVVDSETRASPTVSLVRQINGLKQRVETFEKAEGGEKQREQGRKARDIHQLIVPSLVFLSKRALEARHVQGHLSLKGYEEVSLLLSLSYEAADIACRWLPRPSSLEDGVKSSVRHIRADLSKISDQYALRLQTLRWPSEETRRLDALEKRQIQDQQRLFEFQHQRWQRIREYQRAREEYARSGVITGAGLSVQGMQQTQTESIPASFEALVTRTQPIDGADARGGRVSRERQPNQREVPTSHGQAGEIVDIDNVNNSIAEDAIVSQPTVRPVRRRQPTEEIPGPLQTVWPEAQRQVLITALQFHKGPYRFQIIVDQYGDRLGGRSLDEIVSQAKLIKASLARKLETDPECDAGYDWLRSVPEN